MFRLSVTFYCFRIILLINITRISLKINVKQEKIPYFLVKFCRPVHFRQNGIVFFASSTRFPQMIDRFMPRLIPEPIFSFPTPKHSAQKTEGRIFKPDRRLKKQPFKNRHLKTKKTAGKKLHTDSLKHRIKPICRSGRDPFLTNYWFCWFSAGAATGAP